MAYCFGIENGKRVRYPQARHTVQGKTIHSEKYRPGCSEGFVLAIRTGDGATGIQVIRRAGNSREI